MLNQHCFEANVRMFFYQHWFDVDDVLTLMQNGLHADVNKS